MPVPYFTNVPPTVPQGNISEPNIWVISAEKKNTFSLSRKKITLRIICSVVAETCCLPAIFMALIWRGKGRGKHIFKGNEWEIYGDPVSLCSPQRHGRFNGNPEGCYLGAGTFISQSCHSMGNEENWLAQKCYGRDTESACNPMAEVPTLMQRLRALGPELTPSTHCYHAAATWRVPSVGHTEKPHTCLGRRA